MAYNASMKSIIWLVLFISIVLAGCQPLPPIPVGSTDIALTINKESFSPRTLTVPVASEISLTVDNQADQAATLYLLGQVLTPPVDASDDILWQGTAPAQSVTVLTLTSPIAPAEYDFVISGLSPQDQPNWVVKFVVSRP